MKKLLIAAVVLAAGATTASAQRMEWRPGYHPYSRTHHSVCMDKSERLHRFERRAAADGRLSWRERRDIVSLKRDLDRTCGGWRWRG